MVNTPLFFPRCQSTDNKETESVQRFAYDMALKNKSWNTEYDG